MVMVFPAEGLSYSIDGYLKSLLDSFKYAVLEKNTSVVLIVDGRSGMGKTTLSNQIAKYCYPEYSLENIYFEPNKFLEGLSNAKKFSCHVFDEAMLISNRSSMSSLNRMIIQAMSMIRSKKIFIIFNVNSIFDLDKNLALSRADVLLHVYGDNLIDRGNFAAFFKARGQEDRLKTLYLLGKKYYSYSKPKANFFGSFGMKFILDPDIYEVRKQEGVNAFLRGETKMMGKQLKTVALLCYYLKNTVGLPIEEIANISKLTKSHVLIVLQKLENGE